MCSGSELAEEGLQQLRDVSSAADVAGIENRNLQIDVSIARGLDYYTGTIYETFLDDLPSIGSVCSGGRYDNLAQLYTKQLLPGIGASLGLDRLLAAMETLEMLPSTKTPADVMIVQFDADHLNRYISIARSLRAAGLRVEVFPDAKKLNQQFKYADRRGFQAVIIAGTNEFDANQVQVKWLADGSQASVPLDETTSELAEMLKSGLK